MFWPTPKKIPKTSTNGSDDMNGPNSIFYQTRVFLDNWSVNYPMWRSIFFFPPSWSTTSVPGSKCDAIFVITTLFNSIDVHSSRERCLLFPRMLHGSMECPIMLKNSWQLPPSVRKKTPGVEYTFVDSASNSYKGAPQFIPLNYFAYLSLACLVMHTGL